MNGTTEQAMNRTTEQDLLEELNTKFAMAVLPVTVFVGVEGVCGLLGNLLVLYVYMFPYKQCNFKYFVLCLALTDVTSSLTIIPGEIVTQLFWYKYPVPMVCKIKSFFNMFTFNAEGLCLLTIAIDRYLKVCRPLSPQIKPFVAIVMCGLFYSFAALLALPVAVLWRTHSYNKTYHDRNITVTVCEKDADFLDSKWPFVYIFTAGTDLAICLVSLFILYVFVAKKLFSGKINSKTKSIIQNSQIDMTSLGDKLTGKCGISNFDLLTNPEIDSDKQETSFDMIEDSSSVDNICNTLSVPVLIKQQGTCIKQHNEINPTTKTERTISILLDIKQSNEMKPTSKKERTKSLLPDIKQSNEMNPITKKARTKSSYSDVSTRVRRKTLIMLILTVIFILTGIMYIILASFIVKPEFLQNLSDVQKAVYFFFFRLTFINHVINPVMYGLLDHQFRKVIKQKLCWFK